nr:MAG TPA: hypothetical protein [Caudoviricetes sp.]
MFPCLLLWKLYTHRYLLLNVRLSYLNHLRLFRGSRRISVMQNFINIVTINKLSLSYFHMRLDYILYFSLTCSV